MAKEFTVVKRADTKAFVRDVNEMIKEGWEFLGTTATAGAGDTIYLVQAFTRTIPEEKKKNSGTGVGVVFK